MELGASSDEAFKAVEDLPETFGEFLAATSDDSAGHDPVVAGPSHKLEPCLRYVLGGVAPLALPVTLK